MSRILSRLSAAGIRSEISTAGIRSEVSTPHIRIEISMPRIRSRISMSRILSRLSAAGIRSEISTAGIRSEISTPHIRIEISTPHIRIEISMPRIRRRIGMSCIRSRIGMSCIRSRISADGIRSGFRFLGRRVGERCRGSARVEQQDHVLAALGLELVDQRLAAPRGGFPVDTAELVGGQVLADTFELDAGAGDANWPARRLRLPAAAHHEVITSELAQIGVHPHRLRRVVLCEGTLHQSERSFGATVQFTKRGIASTGRAGAVAQHFRFRWAQPGLKDRRGTVQLVRGRWLVAHLDSPRAIGFVKIIHPDFDGLPRVQ
jgi:hypothetical protein